MGSHCRKVCGCIAASPHVTAALASPPVAWTVFGSLFDLHTANGCTLRDTRSCNAHDCEQQNGL
eukprot:3508409-Rhodomonas_salina.1